MKIYDETTKAELTNPDLTKGVLYDGQVVTGHVGDGYEVMDGTVTDACPAGLERLVPAHDVYEDCQFYHAYSPEELAEQEKPSLQEQVDANAAAILELAQMLAGGE